MSKYVIDINAKPVPEQRRVWRMFPGDEYRFLGSFLSNGLVYLNTPGLTLPKGEITDSTPQMKERLLFTRQTLEWIREYKRFSRSSRIEEAPKRPEKDLNSYSSFSLPRDQYNVFGATRVLFGTAKKGDLVVVPDKIPSRRVMIGEFLDGPETRVEHQEPEFFIDQPILARKVMWFPPVNELRLPRELSSSLRIPPAISLISRAFESSVYEASYGTFYRDNEYFARIKIDSEDFDTQNNFDLGSIAKLASVICSSLGEDAEGLGDALKDYADRLVESEYLPTLTLNINSAGLGGLRAAKGLYKYNGIWFSCRIPVRAWVT